MALTIVTDPLPVFPTDISFGRPGGPEYVTDIAILESGHEQRNAFWPEPRYSWDVGYGVREISKIYALLQFFHSCRGRHKPFRFKDWLDYKSSAPNLETDYDDQTLTTAIAGQVNFQLTKTYTTGAYITKIEIIKPKGSTIQIGVNGSEVTSGWTVNEITGIITASGAPGAGAVITWGGEFYRKARFDVDKLANTFEAWEAGGVEVPVIHLRGT